MAPKVKNVGGSNGSRKGKTSRSSSGREPVQKFGKKAVQKYGWEWFKCQKEAKYMGEKFVNEVRLQSQFPVIYRTMIELGLRSGPVFLEPLDDDEGTVGEAIDDEEEDAVDEAANALMVFDGVDDEA
uniref:Uncharacterized protein n=1 Tax=Solanum tuberosum TaxID=4113 RepID=M1DZ80_SOLTU